MCSTSVVSQEMRSSRQTMGDKNPKDVKQRNKDRRKKEEKARKPSTLSTVQGVLNAKAV